MTVVGRLLPGGNAHHSSRSERFPDFPKAVIHALKFEPQDSKKPSLGAARYRPSNNLSEEPGDPIGVSALPDPIRPLIQCPGEVCAAMTLITSEIGILGAGRVGTALARLALKNKIAASIGGRGSPAELQFMLDFVAPGAKASSAADLLQNSDVIVLAIPSAQVLELDPELLAGKVVIDATNYWAPTDGRIAAYEVDLSTSEVLQARLTTSRLVKTFNHLGYHQMDENALPAGSADRQALAIAGDDPDARAIVAHIVNAIGFDAVDVGPLSAGRALQPDGPLFGHRLDSGQMHALLQATSGDTASDDRQEPISNAIDRHI